jgi:hypothetical protein
VATDTPAPTVEPPPTVLPALTAAPTVEPVEVPTAEVNTPAALGASECARNRYIQVEAIIDPATGGSVTSADGSLTVLIPAGQNDRYTVRIAASSLGADGTPAYGNIQLANQWYMVSVTDSAGNVVVNFNPPMSFKLRPSPCGFKLDQGDWNALTHSILDATTNSFDNVAATVSPDGSVATVVVDQLGAVPAPPSPSVVCSAPTSVVVDPSSGGSITSGDGSLTVVVPPGEPDTLTFNFPSLDDAAAFGNVRVGSHSYALSAFDSVGNAVTSFNPPLSVVVVPGQCTFDLVNDDWSSAIVFALAPGSANFGTVETRPNDQRTAVTADLSELSVAPPRPPTDAAGLDESGVLARATIDQLAAGDHGELPPPQVNGDCGGAAAGIEISNSTSFPLSLYVAGAASGQSITLGAGVSLNLQFEPGQYDVAASVPAANLVPALGTWDVGNCQYTYDFQIS